MATQAEIAAHLDLSPQAVSKMLITMSIPKGRAGYDLDEVRIAYIRRLRDHAAGRTSGGNSLADERARLARLQADSVDTKNRQLAGELIPADEVTASVQSAFARVRAKMLAVPSRAAPLVAALTAPVQCEAKLQELVHEALAELSTTEVGEGQG